MIRYKPYNYFIPRFGKVESDQLLGEETLLNNPYYGILFDAILEDYEPSKPNVLLSICCRIRPYYTSVRWKTFMDTFGDSSDFIVLSPSGFIPMEYSTCYPFMDYQAAHYSKNDEKYQSVMTDRLIRLIEKNIDIWNNIIFVISKGEMDRWIPMVQSAQDKFPDRIKLLPNLSTYEEAVNEAKTEKKFKGNFNRYPLIHPYILEEIGQYIPKNKPSKQSLF